MGDCPHEVIRKLVQAKQGADLHTATFNQIVAYEVRAAVFWTGISTSSAKSTRSVGM